MGEAVQRKSVYGEKPRAGPPQKSGNERGATGASEEAAGAGATLFLVKLVPF